MEVIGVSQVKTGRRGAAVLAPVHPIVGSAVAKRVIVAGTAPVGVLHGGDGGQVPRHRALRWRRVARWRIDEHHTPTDDGDCRHEQGDDRQNAFAFRGVLSP